MSYQVLARKWRPQNFKEMVGQEHVLKALINSLEQKRLHHAYLFTGTRGVGKTTIGRILAKCLNCETGITAMPCGECGACKEITEGRFVDLIEIDAASRTKVEDMRELLDNVQYSPTRGRFKVYLIDEVHMLSSSSFNALLKTLEEPPEHVKFLFATTDPQKLPVTILSRCLQFNLKNMPPERIVGHLKNVLGQENIGFEDSALWLLARSADGSMRDALSLTDQAIAYGNHQLIEREVSAMLGSIDQKQVYRIVEAVANLDARLVLAEVALLADYSPDYSAVLANVISVLHRVAIEQAVPGSTDNSMGDQTQVVDLARALTAEDVQLFYQVALVGRSDLVISPDQRAGLEMVLLRMLAFRPNIDKETPKLSLMNSSSDAPSVETVVNETAVNETTTSESTDLSSGEKQYVEEAPSVGEVPAVEEIEYKTVDEAQHIQPEVTQALAQHNDSDLTAVVGNEVVGNEVVGTNAVETNSSTRSDELSPDHPAFFNETEGQGAVYDESYVQAQCVDNDSGSDFEDNIARGVDVDPVMESAINVTQKKTPEIIVPPTNELQRPVPESVDSKEADVEPVAVTVPITSNPELVGSNPELVSSIPNEKLPELTDIASLLEMGNPWPYILPLLKLTGMTQNLASNTCLTLTQNLATLNAAEGNFRLLTDTHRARITDAFKGCFGGSFAVEFVLGRTDIETPAEWKERKKQERLVLAVSSIENDPNVVSLVNRFDATILKATVEPVD